LGTPSDYLFDPAQLLDPAAVRPLGGSVAEMHAHTYPRSRDSGASSAALVQQAMQRGLDVVTITEHNAVWPEEELQILSAQFGITVLGGMEISTDFGHVLVYGLDHFSPELMFVEKLRPIARSEGAVMVLAHPMRPASHGRSPSWEEIPEYFEGLEAVNGDHGDDGFYRRLASDLGVAALGGSDAHSRVAVGRVATSFAAPVPDIQALIRQVREQTVEPVDLRPPGRRRID
jgi:predicted metal-dependent phosphoesterase TrpH